MTHIIKYTEKRVIPLGILHAPSVDSTKKFIGWTINIPTKYKVSVTMVQGRHRKNVKLCWEYLTHEQQDSFLLNFCRSVIGSHISDFIFVYEQTKAGNLHVHAICYDDQVQNDYALTSLRKSVAQSVPCVRIAGTNMNKHRYLNYIHFLEDIEEWIEYLQKDLLEHDLPIYYSTTKDENPI